MEEWNPDFSIFDPDVVLNAKEGAITEFNINEDADGNYYVTLKLNWRTGLLYLATRREKSTPRLFVNLGKLVGHIRENYKGVKEIKLCLKNPDGTTTENQMPDK